MNLKLKTLENTKCFRIRYKTNRSLLIIADVDQQVMSALAMNKLKGNIKVNLIDAPVYGVNKKKH